MTPAERLLVARRRLGFTQAAMAMSLNVFISEYRRWENGEGDVPRDIDPGDAVFPLATNEACVIARRRRTWSREQLADAVGLSVWTVTKMERGKANADRLADYWGVTC